MAMEAFDPECVRKLMADPVFQARAKKALEDAASKFLDTLPDGELTFDVGTRLATDLDYWLDETGLRPEGFETTN